jgi:hypothetical protein
MKNDELIRIWQKGNDQLFREAKTDKEMITQYLNEKTLKGSRSIIFNIVFYGMIQIANLILISMNLSGYATNPAMIWLLISMLIVTIGILIYGIDLFYRLRVINNYSESLGNLIGKQLRFFRRPYEIWLILTAVSAIILALSLGFYVDNDNGTYAVNNKLMFYGILCGVLLFIYGVQKLASLHTLHSLKAYLDDLQRGVLEQSERLTKTRKKYIWFYLIIFLLLTASMIAGILKATQL